MKSLSAAALACAALAAITTPVLALDAKYESAIKVFEATSNDAAKMKTYCTMNKLMADVGDDEKKAEAAEAQFNGFLKELGPEFETAWTSGEGLDPESADGKAINDALDKLDGKCPK
jgi:hypothetical protein